LSQVFYYFIATILQLKIIKIYNKINIKLQGGYKKMTTTAKKRFVLLVDVDIYEDFKKLAE